MNDRTTDKVTDKVTDCVHIRIYAFLISA